MVITWYTLQIDVVEILGYNESTKSTNNTNTITNTNNNTNDGNNILILNNVCHDGGIYFRRKSTTIERAFDEYTTCHGYLNFFSISSRRLGVATKCI